MCREEWDALIEIFERPIQRWALERAQFLNANRGRDEEPWTVEDFMGSGDRKVRIEERRRNKADVLRMNSQLSKIGKGTIPADLPDFVTKCARPGEALWTN